MSVQLDEKALAEARKAVGTIPGAALWIEAEKAIAAYLAASPSPSMDMGVVAMPGIWETKYLRPDARVCKADEVQSVLSQAQSALAAMRAERDAAIGWPNRSDITHYCTDCEMVAVLHEGRCGCGSGRVVSIASMWQRAEAAEAQVQRLTEENEALRKVVSECAASLMNGAAISTEASLDFMKLLPTEIQMVILAYKARIKALEEALRVSDQALRDWLNTYAPDMCEPARVAEAEARIGAQGTIAYIADALQTVRSALKENAL